MSYHYKTLTCSDCAHPFGFTADDQRIAAEFGYDQPVLCSICHSSRETTRRRSGRDPVRALSVPRLALAFVPIVPTELPV